MGKINIIAIVELLLLLGSAYGISTFFIKPKNQGDRLSHLILGISLGLGLISYLTLLAASLHLLSTWFFWGIILIGNILFLKNIPYLKELSIDWKASVLGIMLSVFLGLNLFYSLFPPSFYDSLLYHLAIPQFYLQQGGIAAWNCNFNSNLPLNGEMLFLFSMLGGTMLIPKLLSLWSGIAILILMFRWYKNQFSPTFTLLPLILFYSIPQVGFLSSSSKTDMLGLMFLFSGFYLFFEYLEMPGSKNNLWLTGLFLGMSVGTKYIFAIYVVAFMLAIFLFTKIPFKKKMVVIPLVSIMIFLCLLPWFIKNTIVSENPVYPYLNTVFKSDFWSPEQAKNFSSILKRGADHQILDYLKYPIELFTRPYQYGLTAVWGILFLISLPFLFFTTRNTQIRVLIFSSLFAFLLLMQFAKVPRYFLGSLLLLSIPTALGIEKAVIHIRMVKKIFIPFLIPLLLLHLILQFDLQEKFFKGFQYLELKIGKKSDNPDLDYLNVIPYYRAAKFINHSLSPDHRIMILGEDRTFYIKRPFLACSFADKHPLIGMLKTKMAPTQIITRMHKQKITHLMYSEKGLKRLERLSRMYHLSDTQWEKLGHLLKHLKPIYRDHRYTVYQII